MQIGKDRVFELSDMGLTVENENGLDIYGSDGTLLRTLPNATLNSGWDNYRGSDKTGWFDITTGEPLNITMPESGITVVHYYD